MKICIWNGGIEYFDMKTEDLLANHFLLETDSEIIIGIPFIFNNQYYHVCSIRPQEDTAVVRTFTPVLAVGDVLCADEITCPYCSSEVGDSWECGDSEEIVCSVCNSKYNYDRQVDVSYGSEPVEKFEIPEIKEK